MQRLNPTHPNNGTEYDAIFSASQDSGYQWDDLRRWKELLRHYRGGPLIDLACGDSPLCAMAKKLDPVTDIAGVDVAPKTIERMRQRCPSINWFHVPAIPWDGYPWFGGFSYAVLGEVLEHMEDPAAVVRKGIEVLKPGGILAVSVPLEEAREPGAVDREHHLWSFSRNDIITMLKPYGSVETKTLRSQWFPRYRYAWPTLVAWMQKI